MNFRRSQHVKRNIQNFYENPSYSQRSTKFENVLKSSGKAIAQQKPTFVEDKDFHKNIKRFHGLPSHASSVYSAYFVCFFEFIYCRVPSSKQSVSNQQANQKLRSPTYKRNVDNFFTGSSPEVPSSSHVRYFNLILHFFICRKGVSKIQGSAFTDRAFESP